jgi:hypothetical protein
MGLFCRGVSDEEIFSTLVPGGRRTVAWPARVGTAFLVLVLACGAKRLAVGTEGILASSSALARVFPASIKILILTSKKSTSYKHQPEPFRPFYIWVNFLAS